MDGDDANFGSWRKTIHAMETLKTMSLRRGEEAQVGSDDSEHDEDSEVSDPSEPTSESDGLTPSHTTGGLRYWNPRLYQWVQARLGTRAKVSIIVALIILEGSMFSMQEDVYTEDVSVISLVVVSNAVSLAMSLVASFTLEGMGAIPKVSDWHSCWRFALIAAMFMVAAQCQGLAFKYGLPAVYRNTLSYLYLPFAALGSYVVFRRQYGQLEWLSLLMMMLAIATFILLRERCKAGSCGDQSLTEATVFDPRIFYTLVSVIIGVIASLLAERIFKGRSGVQRRLGYARTEHYYIMKVHLDLCSLAFSLVYWVFPTIIGHSVLEGKCAETDALGSLACAVAGSNVYWFGNWTRWHFLFVFICAGQWWMAGLVTKRFSTVIKSVVQSVAIVLVVEIKDPMFHLYRFEDRWIPSTCMACIIVLAALMFQTGRINLQLIRRVLGQAERPHIVDLSVHHMGASLLLWVKDHKPDIGQSRRRWRERTARSDGSGGHTKISIVSDGEDNMPLEMKTPVSKSGSSVELMSGVSSSPLELLGNYSVLIAYVLADATRTEFQTIAMGASMITPQSMAIMVNVASLFLFNFMVFISPRENSTGWQDLCAAWNFRKIMKFMPCGFLFAATSALMSMGMGLGISGSLSVVVGKIYLPIAALASRWILGKFYLWLEWLAIIILTLDSAAFGFLQTMGKTGRPTNPVAILCVAGSATSAALNSLTMEMLMKGESDPFVMQKVRLDMGSVLWSIVFLPVMAWLADPTSYPQGAYYSYRPNTRECTWAGYCDDQIFMYVNQTDGTESMASAAACSSNAAFCGCYCDRGVFVYWSDNLSLYMFLIVSVLHSTIVGMVVTRFSSVYRAVADNFSLLLVYFVGDPWVWGSSTSDKSTNLVAFILPLSSQAFTLAASELKRVKEIQAQAKELAYAESEDE